MGRAFLVLLAAGAVLSAVALNDLAFDHDTRSLLRADPTADAREEQLGEVFGAEDILLLAWETDDITAPDEFARVLAVTKGLQAIEGLDEVYSIANQPVLLSGAPLPTLLDAENFTTPKARAQVRQALRLAKVYSGTFYSRDLDVLAVASSLKPGTRAEREATLVRVRRVAARFEGTEQIHVSGVTPFAVEAAEYAISDLKRLGLLAFLVAVVVLLLLCRSVRETLIAAIATSLPPLYALGLAAALDLPLTALGAALFPVMAVVGITSSVHLLNACGEEGPGGAGRAARRLAPPIMLSLLTTAVAFFSLRATGVPAFHDAGVVVAMGLLAAIPVILLGIPAALQLAAARHRRRRTRRIDRFLLGMGRFVRKRAGAIAWSGLALALACAWLVPRSRLQVQVLQAFQSDSNIAKTYGFLEQRLTATVPLDLVLDARKADKAKGVKAATDAEILRDLRAFDAAASAIGGVDALGLNDLVEYGRNVVDNDAFALGVLRGAMATITSRFEDFEGRRYRVKLRIHEGTGPEVLDQLEELAKLHFQCGKATLTGLFLRAVGTTRHLIVDLARGTLLMTLLVVLIVAAALRSLRLGLAALLPNLLPPLVVFGVAAAAGMPLDVSAVAVGAVAIGLAIDDTLHILFRVSREIRRGRSVESALLRTQRSVGRALVLSTVVLAAGLSCLIFSRFLPTARFGLFAAASSVVALFADLLLLPALLRVLRVFRPRLQ